VVYEEIEIKNMFILIHSIASIIALMVGSVSLVKVKGTKFHKTLGWVFIIFMFLSAISSFVIYNTHFSVIHILSLLVMFWLSRAVYAIRFRPKHWRHIHASSVGAAYIAILIAGVGVLVRKIVLPGNTNAGYIASGVTAIILVYILNKMTDKYKRNELI